MIIIEIVIAGCESNSAEFSGACTSNRDELADVIVAVMIAIARRGG
jgi:hypothetical protein